jgi:hypothetical protein
MLYRLLFPLLSLGCTAVDVGDLLRRWKSYIPNETHGQASIKSALGGDIRAETNQ